MPRPRTSATPSGPRNSNALAVPRGSRTTAAMNSIVTLAVHTPSAIEVSSAERVNDRAPRSNQGDENQARHRETQPCDTRGAEFVAESDRHCDPDLHKAHRGERHQRALAGGALRSGRHSHQYTQADLSVST